MRLHIFFILFISLALHSTTLLAQKILFVGNSLTYTNDLPKILEHIAHNFDIPVETTTLCFPNYGLEDHWNDGKFQELMSKREFDYVVVQQGPSSQMPGKRMLLEYGAKIKGVCKDKGVELAYFMVWPSKQYYFTFDGVIENYSLAAKKTESIVFPVGAIWKDYEAAKGYENLYGNDGFHPSTAGSFLAALTLFHGLHPEKKLYGMNFEKYTKWVMHKDSFQKMVQLVGEQ